jgi:capsular polysaccharide transport system permease protein
MSVQGRVLWALCLREIRGKHGKSKLGYLWQLFKMGFAMGVFWWIREMIHFTPPGGLPTPIFLLMGFIPWFIFSQTFSMVMEAVPTNNALLTFPQITPLDLCLSSALVVWCTEVVVLLLYMAGLILAGYHCHLYNLFIPLIVLVGIWLLGFGFGLTLGALALHFEVLEKLVPMFRRLLFFISGVFFSPIQLSARFGEWIMWNPLANFLELMRSAFMSSHTPDIIKTKYILGVTFAVLVLGLLLERASRSMKGR